MYQPTIQVLNTYTYNDRNYYLIYFHTKYDAEGMEILKMINKYLNNF